MYYPPPTPSPHRQVMFLRQNDITEGTMEIGVIGLAADRMF